MGRGGGRSVEEGCRERLPGVERRECGAVRSPRVSLESERDLKHESQYGGGGEWGLGAGGSKNRPSNPVTVSGAALGLLVFTVDTQNPGQFRRVDGSESLLVKKREFRGSSGDACAWQGETRVHLLHDSA